MLGQKHLQKGIVGLTADHWCKILAIAEQHRLLPLLHARIERGDITREVPAVVRQRLRKAHRESALSALVQRSELFSTVELLRAAGLETVVLKGGWLAWYAYPSAAERPLRDIDLLLRPNQALVAFELLRENGFVQQEASALPAAQMVGSAKHLPPLTSPSGVEFELHMHAWEPPGSTEWPMPTQMDELMFTGAQPGGPGDPCRYPKPYHMLIHLLIHAAYSHRFDVGPLILSDIDFLLKSHSVDWHNFWRDAEKGGFAKGAMIVLLLASRWTNNGQIGWRNASQITHPELLDDCEKLLVQDLSQRKNVGVAAAILDAQENGGFEAAIARLKDRVSGRTRGAFAADDGQNEGYLHWFARRTAGFASSIASPDLRATAAQKARIGRYLSDQE